MAQESSIMELDQSITSHQRALSWIPRSHPTYTAYIHLLARSRFERHKLSKQKEDLDKSILHYTEAIFLPPSWGFYLNVVQVFFQLVISLLRRSNEFEQPEDAKCAVEYLRYLRGLPLDTFEVPHEAVKTLLVQALGIQVKLEAAKYPTHAITALFTAFLWKFNQGRPVQPLDGVIQCFRDALKIFPPGSHLVLLGLATSFSIRYLTNYSNDDYDEAMALLESLIASSPSRDDQIYASALAAVLALNRAMISLNPEYLEEAISRCRTLLGSSSLDNNLRHLFTHGMGSLAKMRFHNFGLTEILQEARSYTSEMVSLASSSSAHGLIDKLGAVRAAYPMKVVEEIIRNLRELISKTPPGNSNHNTHIMDLVNWYETKFSRTNDITDLEEVIKCRRVLLASADTSHSFGSKTAFYLGFNLYMAFECSNKMEYLDESITMNRGVLEMQSTQPYYFISILQLFVTLSKRFRLLGRRQDLDEMIELFPLAVNDKFAKVPDLFALSCVWASAARTARHPSVAVMYEKAMSIIQSSYVSAPTLEIQHARLVAIRGIGDKMPLDYASYQIDMGQFTQAIETLERGRALLWSEMRSLRNSMDHLSGVNSPLAAKLAAIDKDLESLTMSVTPSGTIGISDAGSQVDDGMDPFGRLVVKQQKLLEERDLLVSQIQELPGYGDFLKTPSFENIRSAASHGPVIIINHNKWRSDILILFQDTPPSLIPTNNDFYDRANKLRDRLVVARKEGLDSGEYKRALRSVLEGLYNLVGEPVIHKFRTLGVPEQSRIWWCPTSVFCSLPLHAMGPIPSNDGVKRYFSDLYIPSYTSTLSALIESRKPSAFGEMEIIQSFNSRVPVTTLCGKNATPAGVVEGLRHHGLVHFVCHGTLETGKPFDASFKLFDDERLTLLDIVRSQLPAAEFAFLAACHTAELTDESIADEGLHLTAAVQYCGFRSVVGTMWEMADIDGSEIAENFYKSMFSRNGEGVHYHLRSARALRDATRKMRRKKGMTLERWVNFVHYVLYPIQHQRWMARCPSYRHKHRDGASDLTSIPLLTLSQLQTTTTGVNAAPQTLDIAAMKLTPLSETLLVTMPSTILKDCVTNVLSDLSDNAAGYSLYYLGQSLTFNKDSELEKHDDPSQPIVGLTPSALLMDTSCRLGPRSAHRGALRSLDLKRLTGLEFLPCTDSTSFQRTEADHIHMMLNQAAGIFNTRSDVLHAMNQVLPYTTYIFAY
ncbi:CHAT domain-containing protein [Multifurca ochricompacta]|uniref:CHAT domain-containing protein n=1 Tax=Multifurca ochricompacta TaxID=376703 RepID=A0AAD4LY84_9AGAM|nr:CHAT domain-containing protein [Multifurca ochricompacta]